MVSPCVGKAGDAEADRQRHGILGEAFADRVAHSLRGDVGAALVAVGEQDGKLLAADPGDEVDAPVGGAQDLRGAAQCVVAARMPRAGR